MHPTHLDESERQRLRHGELGPAEEAATRAHLAGCAGCRERAAHEEHEEEEVYALLQRLDHSPPRVTAAAVAARAAARSGGWGRWAAGLFLLLGAAGAAYAMPGSPIPAWVAAVVGRAGRAPAPVSSAPASAPSPDVDLAGIAVAPGESLLIRFTSSQPRGKARVSLTDGAEVVVRAPTGAVAFTSDRNRLTIDNRGSSASFEIEIPRAAPWVEIRVARHRIFLKQETRVAAPGAADSAGSYHLPLGSAAR